jgi:small-conductance mechanosensitive channel
VFETANPYNDHPTFLHNMDHSPEKPMSTLPLNPSRWFSVPLFLLAVLASLCLSPISAAAQETESAESAQLMGESDEINVAPVIVDGQTVLRVRGITAFPAEKRADLIAGRIRAIAADRSISTSTLRSEHSDDLTRILAGRRLVMVVTDADARLEQLDRRNLAAAYVTRIGEVMQGYRRDRSAEQLARSGLYALAATGGFALVLWLGTRATRKLDAVLERRVKARLAGIEAKSLRLLNAAQLWQMLRSLRVLVWVAVVVGASLVYLDFLLHLFPWTRWFGVRLFDLLFDPLRTIGAGIVAAIPDLVFLAILVVVVRFVLKALHMLFSGIAEGTVTITAFEREWSWPTYRLVRLLVLAFSVVVAYPYIPGSGSDAFKGVSLFLGVIFSLGSSSVISNVIAGYTMTYRRAFRIGDRVRIEEHLGDVAEMRLLVTHLRSPKNEEIVIPNSLILNSSVVNYSSLAREGKLILNTTVGIGYETPWRQVEAMLLQAAERTEGLLREPGAFVLQKALGDFAVTYEINAYCDDAQAMNRLYTRLYQNILDVFNEYDVQIMTPAYEGDPEQPKIVPKSQWYAAPASAPIPR